MIFANALEFHFIFLCLPLNEKLQIKKAYSGPSSLKLICIIKQCRLKFPTNYLPTKANEKISTFSGVAEYLNQKRGQILYAILIM